MRVRSVLLAVTAAVALSAVPLGAHAGTAGGRTEMHDRSIFDGAVEKTADSMHFEGQARGELGYFLDVTVTAEDGSLPTGSNVCEPADVSAKLTLPSRESMSVNVEGRFQNVTVARTNTDGSISQSCVNNPQAAGAFFGIDPKLIEHAEGPVVPKSKPGKE